MDELDRAGARVLVSPVCDPTAIDRLRVRVRRRVVRRRALVVVVVGCVLAIPAVAVADRPNGGPVASAYPKAALAFRAVQYSGDSPLQFPATAASCATPAERRSIGGQGRAVVFDRAHQYCYVVGPTLLTGAGLRSVSVTYDVAESQWAADLHWSNDDFITKVARPLVNKEVAIVVNGIVQSAPVINPGITGTSVEITGNFTKTAAVDLAASIMSVGPSAIHNDSTAAASG